MNTDNTLKESRGADMEKRNLKVSFVKSGSGSITPRLILPKTFTDKLNITADERDVVLTLDEEKEILTIEKVKPE